MNAKSRKGKRGVSERKSFARLEKPKRILIQTSKRPNRSRSHLRILRKRIRIQTSKRPDRSLYYWFAVGEGTLSLHHLVA
jgi:hypothetical protein